MDEVRVCKSCAEEFIPKRHNQAFCKRNCQNDTWKKKYRELNPIPELQSSTTGAMHELLVAVDLMRCGFVVYRSMAPNAPCDLAILKEKKLIMVEVTTGHRNTKNSLIYPSHKKNSHIFDVLAVVEYTGRITYYPDKPDML